MSTRRLAVLAGLAGAAALLRRSRPPSAESVPPDSPGAAPEAEPAVPDDQTWGERPPDAAGEREAVEVLEAATDESVTTAPDAGLPPGWEAVEAVPVPRPAASSARPGPLRGITEIRDFLRANDVPVWFVSPTAFTLLGLDRWVRRLTYVNYYDSFEGAHPNVFVPSHLPSRPLGSIQTITNVLLSNDEVVERIARGGRGKALFLRFDDEAEQLAEAAGLEVAFPSSALRSRLDSKIEATRLAREVGVPTVPHVLGSARSYEGLVSLATGAGLGRDLVVQTPHGDSRTTTFSIGSRDDWETHAAKLADEHLKVMRRATFNEVAVEAVVTAHGTLIGPLVTDATGFRSPMPSVVGWCSTDAFPAALTEEQRRRTRDFARDLGDRLCEEGYRGTVTLEFLVEPNGGEVYVGALDPYLTGTSALNNITAVGEGDMPLSLFHLLEFIGVEYEIDVDALNRGWAAPRAPDAWAQLVLKDNVEGFELITEAPRSGVWRCDPDAHGGIRFVRPETDWHTVADENEAFYLRVSGTGHYRYAGADLGVIVTRGRLQTDDHELGERARNMINAIGEQFWTAPPPSVPSEVPSGETLTHTVI